MSDDDDKIAYVRVHAKRLREHGYGTMTLHIDTLDILLDRSAQYFAPAKSIPTEAEHFRACIREVTAIVDKVPAAEAFFRIAMENMQMDSERSAIIAILREFVEALAQKVWGGGNSTDRTPMQPGLHGSRRRSGLYVDELKATDD